MMAKTRAKFDKTTKAMQVLEQLSTPQLEDKEAVQKHLKAAGLKLVPAHWGRLRHKVLANRTDAASSTGTAQALHTDTPDLLKRIKLVGNLSQKIGGLQAVKDTIDVIEKVKEI